MGDAWNVELRRRLWDMLQEVRARGGTVGLHFTATDLDYLIQALDWFEKPVAVNACQDSAALAKVVTEMGRRVKALEDWKGRCCSV